MIWFISIKSISEQAGVSEGTLYAIEKGSDSVSIGAYAAVLSYMARMQGEITRRDQISI